MRVRNSDISRQIRIPKNTDFIIEGFLAGLPQSPLILCLLFQDITSNLEIINVRDIQPTDFLVFINVY